LGLAVAKLDVVIPPARFGIAFASGLGSFVFVIAGVIEVLIVSLANKAGTNRLHVPDVSQLAFVRQVLIAKRFPRLAGVAGHHAALLAEVLDRVADVPDQRNLVFIVDVVISTFVVGVSQFLPAAVGLLLIRKAAYRLCRIAVVYEHVERGAGIIRLDGRGGFAVLEVCAACKGNRDRLGLGPCRIGGTCREVRGFGLLDGNDRIRRRRFE